MPDLLIKPFADLTLDELYGLLAVRGEVFVVGQKITSEPDLDGKDQACWHVLVREDTHIVGTCRLLPLDGGKQIKMGRLAVLEACRGKGYARAIFDAVHGWLDERGLPAQMHGQRYLETFYASLGWRTVGEPFDEAGIEHVKMVRETQTTSSS